MSKAFTRVLGLVDAYLADGKFWVLWNPIAGPDASDEEPGQFEPTEEPFWDELYEVVYMGQPDSATPGEARDGLLGGPELQSKLRQWRAAALAALSA